MILTYRTSLLSLLSVPFCYVVFHYDLLGLQTEMEAGKEYTVMGRMTLVDLAGSERLKTTQSSGKVIILCC